MKSIWAAAALLIALSICSAPASAQQTIAKGDRNWTELEKVLWDVEQQWLGIGPYYKANPQESAEFRLKYKSGQFFDIDQNGRVQTKAEQAASQFANAKAHPDVPVAPGAAPQEFKLMAVYGDFALATDHTFYRSRDANGNSVTSEASVLRMFAKENGAWRPAGSARISIPAK